MSTVEQAANKDDDPEEIERKGREELKPLLSQCYNLLDFEAVARRVMKKTAWGYYSSASDDEIVRHSSFLSLFFFTKTTSSMPTHTNPPL